MASRQVEELLGARLLLPINGDRFNVEDMPMGKLLAHGLSCGLRIEDLTYGIRLGEQIVDHEMKLRRRLAHHLPYAEDAALTLEMVRSAGISCAYATSSTGSFRAKSPLCET